MVGFVQKDALLRHMRGSCVKPSIVDNGSEAVMSIVVEHKNRVIRYNIAYKILKCGIFIYLLAERSSGKIIPEEVRQNEWALTWLFVTRKKKVRIDSPSRTVSYSCSWYCSLSFFIREIFLVHLRADKYTACSGTSILQLLGYRFCWQSLWNCCGFLTLAD